MDKEYNLFVGGIFLGAMAAVVTLGLSVRYSQADVLVDVPGKHREVIPRVEPMFRLIADDIELVDGSGESYDPPVRMYQVGLPGRSGARCYIVVGTGVSCMNEDPR